MNITERFLNYVKFDTQSAEESQTVPSTSKQLIFAEYLRDELKAEGFADVEMDEQGYIYATLKANTKKEIPTIGFISHYDTSPDCSGKDVKPRIVKEYDGGDNELAALVSASVWTLGHLPADKQTTGGVLDLLEDEHEWVVRYSIEALAHFGDLAAIEPLEELAESEDEAIRELASQALDMLH